MTDLDAIRERHQRWQEGGNLDIEAGYDRRDLLARVAELEAALTAIRGTDVSAEGEPARPEPKP